MVKGLFPAPFNLSVWGEQRFEQTVQWPTSTSFPRGHSWFIPSPQTSRGHLREGRAQNSPDAELSSSRMGPGVFTPTVSVYGEPPFRVGLAGRQTHPVSYRDQGQALLPQVPWKDSVPCPRSLQGAVP